MSRRTWHCQGPCKQSGCKPLAGAELPQAKKVLRLSHTVTFVVYDSLWPCRLWPARLLCQGGGLSRQEYWSILTNTGCQSLLEHYISCCPSCQLPWVPGAARTPETQAAVSSPHLALTGANPSPPGQPQEQTPMDDPHAEVKIKPQLKSRGSVAKEEDPRPSHHLQIKSIWLTRQTRVYGIYKRSLRAPPKETTLVLPAVDIGGKNTQE